MYAADAEQCLMGVLVYLKQPQGVMNVVSRRLSLSRLALPAEEAAPPDDFVCRVSDPLADCVKGLFGGEVLPLVPGVSGVDCLL